MRNPLYLLHNDPWSCWLYSSSCSMNEHERWRKMSVLCNPAAKTCRGLILAQRLSVKTPPRRKEFYHYKTDTLSRYTIRDTMDLPYPYLLPSYRFGKDPGVILLY